MPNGRLLFYTPGLVGGGAERVWALLAAGLHARGWDVTFGVDYEASENAGLLPKDMRRVLFGRGHGNAVRTIARYLKAERPVVAFAAVGASNLKLMLAKALARWRGAAVLSAHGRFDAEGRFLGRFSYASTPVTSRLAARTVVVSDDLRDYLIKRFRARPDRVTTIHNAIHLPPADHVPSAAELAARPDVVLAVGRLVPEKDFETLLRAVALSARRPHLVVLGDGPERQKLTQLAETLGIAGRVDFRGYLNAPWPVFREAKMLALSSRTEAFGNVLVEALGHGLPVVATRCGGPEEVLAEGRFGRLVAIGDVAGLAQAIDATLADPGDPAPRRARADEFSLDVALDRFEALIAEVRRP
ncbi:MAG: glycosyltransferase [Alphaproteobacteria bacterium]|nr:glycosyltransferase [Alphaproteobacteria bacterium]